MGRLLKKFNKTFFVKSQEANPLVDQITQFVQKNEVIFPHFR